MRNTKQNAPIVQSIGDENDYGTVINTIVESVMFLIAKGLPLRGTEEILGSDRNGNFLGLIELLSNYNSKLAVHLDRITNAKNKIVEFIKIISS